MPRLSSILARRIVYPFQERALRRPTFGYLAELERTQWTPRESVEHLQREKLLRLLREALDHCPWHAQRIHACGLAESVKRKELTLHDLHRLPTMTKADARENGEAMRWFRRAADQGNEVAQRNIAIMYVQGLGVAADKDEAIRWFKQAAAAGDDESKDALKQLGAE